MRRARRLKIASVVCSAVTVVALAAVLVIVLRNQFSAGLITLTVVLGGIGVIAAAGALLSFGFGREGSVIDTGDGTKSET